MLDAKVLIVCDDLETANIWGFCLRQRGILVSVANQVEMALTMWTQEIPDLVVIDISDQKLDRIALIKELRQQAFTPIILLSPETSETYMLKAYQAGVDEFISKPVSPALFLAKVKAWLRRSWTVQTDALNNLQIDSLSLDPSKRQVVIGEREPVRLTNLEFRLLYLLMNNPGRIFETSEIVARVWGHYGDGDSNLLKSLVYRLRRKIDPDQDQLRYIHTEAGLGYKFLVE
jgi:DNA-binding response OmpR family regulator